MVVKLYISGISGNKEVKKKQQRVQMILDSKSISYEAIDITEPGREKEKEFMQQKSKVRENLGKHPLPPQIFNEDDYCGDYEDFDMANEIDELEAFLHLPIPTKLSSNETAINDTKQINGSREDGTGSEARNGKSATEVNGHVELSSIMPENDQPSSTNGESVANNKIESANEEDSTKEVEDDGERQQPADIPKDSQDSGNGAKEDQVISEESENVPQTEAADETEQDLNAKEVDSEESIKRAEPDTKSVELDVENGMVHSRFQPLNVDINSAQNIDSTPDESENLGINETNKKSPVTTKTTLSEKESSVNKFTSEENLEDLHDKIKSNEIYPTVDGISRDTLVNENRAASSLEETETPSCVSDVRRDIESSFDPTKRNSPTVGQTFRHEDSKADSVLEESASIGDSSVIIATSSDIATLPAPTVVDDIAGNIANPIAGSSSDVDDNNPLRTTPALGAVGAAFAEEIDANLAIADSTDLGKVGAAADLGPFSGAIENKEVTKSLSHHPELQELAALASGIELNSAEKEDSIQNNISIKTGYAAESVNPESTRNTAAIFKEDSDLDTGGKSRTFVEEMDGPPNHSGIPMRELLNSRVSPFDIDRITYSPQLASYTADAEERGVRVKRWDRRPSEIELVHHVRGLLNERDLKMSSRKAKDKFNPHHKFLDEIFFLINEVSGADETVSYPVVRPPPPPVEIVEPPVDDFMQQVLRALNGPAPPKKEIPVPKAAEESGFLQDVWRLLNAENLVDTVEGQCYPLVRKRIGNHDDSAFVHKVRSLLDEKDEQLKSQAVQEKPIDHSKFLTEVFSLLSDAACPPSVADVQIKITSEETETLPAECRLPEAKGDNLTEVEAIKEPETPSPDVNIGFVRVIMESGNITESIRLKSPMNNKKEAVIVKATLPQNVVVFNDQFEVAKILIISANGTERELASISRYKSCEKRSDLQDAVEAEEQDEKVDSGEAE